MPNGSRFEGEISAASAEDFELLRRSVASALQAQNVSPEWGQPTIEKGMFQKKDILAFAFNLAVGLTSNVAASAIYDEIKPERPSATMTTDASGGCTITEGKSSIYISPAPESSQRANSP